MEKEDPDFHCKMGVMDISVMKAGYVHEAMEMDPGHPIIHIVTEATQDVFGKTPDRTYFPAWSDGGLLDHYANIPTIIFAPGDLETAHSATEHIDLAQVYPAALIYAAIAMKFCKE